MPISFKYSSKRTFKSLKTTPNKTGIEYNKHMPSSIPKNVSKKKLTYLISEISGSNNIKIILDMRYVEYLINQICKCKYSDLNEIVCIV